MRKFTPRELNHLIKFNFDTYELAQTVDPNIPVEYITGKAEFRDQTFSVTKDTLIPRIETEQIIDLAIEKMKDEKLKNEKVIYFADIATGSGCIGISFAIELVKRNIQFNGNLSDVSRSTLLVAYDNASSLLRDKVKINFARPLIGAESQSNELGCINIFNSNLLDLYDQRLATSDQRLDLIFANLPYIPTSRISNLDKSVKDFEPHLALDGGEQGLDLIRKLLNQAPEFLNKDGIVILEVDDSHTDPGEFAKKWNIEIIKDLNDKIRFWSCTLRQ